MFPADCPFLSLRRTSVNDVQCVWVGKKNLLASSATIQSCRNRTGQVIATLSSSNTLQHRAGHWLCLSCRTARDCYRDINDSSGNALLPARNYRLGNRIPRPVVVWAMMRSILSSVEHHPNCNRTLGYEQLRYSRKNILVQPIVKDGFPSVTITIQSGRGKDPTDTTVEVWVDWPQ